MSNLSKVFTHIIMPAERVLQEVETYGAYIDYDKLLEVREDYGRKLEVKTKELQSVLPSSVDWEVNWNSPKQVADVLFNHCKLKPLGTTPTGSPETGKSTLLRLVDVHPVPALLLDVRKYSKAISGFLDPWKAYLDYEQSFGRPRRLHTTYNIAKTNTGRLSAEDPNLQQVSRDKAIRSLVSAPPGYVIVEADYSQIELRIAAFIARAMSMIKVYRRNGDIHLETAVHTSHLPEDKITKELRTRAKAVNFGYIYGMWWRAFKAYAFDSYGVIVTDVEAKQSREGFLEDTPS